MPSMKSTMNQAGDNIDLDYDLEQIKDDLTGRNQIAFQAGDGRPVLWAKPTNKWQLKTWIEWLFGLKMAHKAVCPGHSSPLDALAASYFAISPVVIWYASRGFGGKTTGLSVLSMLELMDGANVNVLGGSGRQSQRVNEAVSEAWNRKVEWKGDYFRHPLRSIVLQEPTTYHTTSKHGNRIIALTASQASVRGPHPQRLRLDEVDEIDWPIYEAAMGQAMSSKGISAQTTLSSTLQYSDGTFTKVLNLAAERGWPTYRWCWRESSVRNGGWLTDDEVRDKQKTVTRRMWRIEYDLEKPRPVDAILDTKRVEEVFSLTNPIADEPGVYYEYEGPEADGKYITSADWARDEHYTVIVTVREDVFPMRLVAYERVQKLSYPALVKKFDTRCERFPGRYIHDATGVGAVVEDLIKTPGVTHYKVSSKEQSYGPYVLGVEKQDIEGPHYESLVAEHESVTNKDIYGSGHPPDGFVAMALAWLVHINKHLKGRNPGTVLTPITIGGSRRLRNTRRREQMKPVRDPRMEE